MLKHTFLKAISALCLVMLVLLFVLPAPASLSKQEGGTRSVLLIENVNLFDGVVFREKSNMLVKNGLVMAVGQSLDSPEGAKRIDGVGLTALPGLIDAHTHTYGNALAESLRFGVSVNLDMFMSSGLMKEVQVKRDQIRPTKEADLFSAGTLGTVEGGHGTQFGVPVETLRVPADAESWVARRKKEGSDYIKLVYIPGQTRIPSLDLDSAQAIIKAAHAEGLMALAHISTQAAAMDMVEAGIDGLVHVFADEAVSDAFIAKTKANGVFIIPTLTVLSGISQEGGNAAFARDARIMPYLAPGQAESLTRSFGTGVSGYNLSIALGNVGKLHAAGVPILAGSDAPNPGTTHGASLHHELELLVRAGLSNADALQAASSVSAEYFNLEGRGRLIAGSRADFSLVAGNPMEDITQTRRIVSVYKNGYEVERLASSGKIDAVELTENLSQFDKGLNGPNGLIWTGTDDSLAGGNSTVHVQTNAEGQLDVEAEIRDGFVFPWAGAFLTFADEASAPASLAQFKRVTFQARGKPGTYRVMLFDTSAGGIPPTQNFQMSEDWQDVSLDLEGFTGFSKDTFTGLAIVAGPDRGEFHYQLDDVILK